jgi:predicted ATPase
LPEAELNRHKGPLLQQQGHSSAAEELYRKALSISREQEARLWELRDAANLARLWRDQGRRAEARDLLAPVYTNFIAPRSAHPRRRFRRSGPA